MSYCPRCQKSIVGDCCPICMSRTKDLGGYPTESTVSYVSHRDVCPICKAALNHGHQNSCLHCGRTLIWECE